jgi:KH domain
VTDNSAFKNQVRARMAETGEKYTIARRTVIAGHGAGQPPVIVRVYLHPYVDLELTAQAGQAYAGADEQGRRDMVDRLLADQIEVAGFEEARIAASSKIITGQEVSAEDEAAEDAAIRGAVRHGVERAAGVSAVEIDRTGDGVRVDIRTTQPDIVMRHRGAEADRIRGELEELTGGPVRLNLLWAPGPQETADDDAEP